MERIPPRTYEVQARALLGLQALQDWVDWAIEAIIAGYDSQSLFILAGLQPPYDEIEIWRLTTRAFADLSIVSLKRENCYPYYIGPLLQRALDNKAAQKEALARLQELYLATNYERRFLDFYLLHNALGDLEAYNEQWYWNGANRENISKIIDDYFRDWLKNQGQEALA